MRTHDIELLISDALYGIGEDNLIRVNFVGERELELRCDKEFLTNRFLEKYY